MRIGTKMKNPIFILGAHKSGTSLLRSLLDGHPELFVIPLETHIFQCGNYWVDYRGRRTHPSTKNQEEIVRAFYSNLKNYNETGSRTADANLVGTIDLESFRTYFETIPHSFKSLIKKYFEGIYVALTGQKFKHEVRFVEKSVENAEFALDLQGFFEESIFLYVLRNPYSNLVSFRKHSSRNERFSFLRTALLSLQNSYYFLYRNLNLLPKKMLVVKYEDILLKSEKTMREVSKFVDIQYDACLMEPTLLGIPWRGNSSRGFKFRGICADNLDKWREEISSLEIYYVNYLFDFLLDRFGYEKLEPSGNFWRYVFGEGPKNYLFNRLLQYYIR